MFRFSAKVRQLVHGHYFRRFTRRLVEDKAADENDEGAGDEHLGHRA